MQDDNIKEPSSTSSTSNGWSMMTEVFKSAIDKGQLIPISIFFLLFTLIVRLKPDDAFKLLCGIGDTFHDWHMLGWGGCVVIGIFWYLHQKWVSKTNQKEVDRIADEKKVLQDMLLQKHLPSNKNR